MNLSKRLEENGEPNVMKLMALRECGRMGPRRSSPASGPADIDVQAALLRWVEGDFLRRCYGTYCSLRPSPRSTIAAAFSPDGSLIASTHGDHTVKLVDVRTGRCVQTLMGHRRTPWVVRFHPRLSHLLASGSLDHEVRVWNATKGECICFWDFERPIASLAFNVAGNLLAVASGHKLYMWDYTRAQGGSDTAPNVVLRTKRSLRAVHFAPHGAPHLMTAEVNDIGPSPTDIPVALAPTDGPLSSPGDAAAEAAARAVASAGAAGGPSRAWDAAFAAASAAFTAAAGAPAMGGDRYAEARGNGPAEGEGGGGEADAAASVSAAATAAAAAAMSMLAGTTMSFLAGATIQSAVAAAVEGIAGGAPQRAVTAAAAAAATAAATAVAAAAGAVEQPCTVRLRLWPLQPKDRAVLESASLNVPHVVLCSEMGAHFSPCGRFLAACVACLAPTPQGGDEGGRTAAAAAADAADAEAAAAAAAVEGMEVEAARAMVVDTGAETWVDAGAGRWGNEAGGVAPPAPPTSPTPLPPPQPPTDGFSTPPQPPRPSLSSLAAPPAPHGLGVFAAAMGDLTAAAPIAAAPAPALTLTEPPPTHPNLTYELRVYSLERATFGAVLAARAVKAAHCLTSVQWSPTSGYVMLAYGRRHISLLRSIIADNNSIIPVHTILEVYRTCDMTLVRTLPSADDEVNVACFHPLPAGGLVYGTKEGRLRILRADRAPSRGPAAGDRGARANLDHELVEAERSGGQNSDVDDA